MKQVNFVGFGQTKVQIPIIRNVGRHKIQMPRKERRETLLIIRYIYFKARFVVKFVKNVFVNAFGEPIARQKNLLTHIGANDVGIGVFIYLKRDGLRLHGFAKLRHKIVWYIHKQLLPKPKTHFGNVQVLSYLQNVFEVFGRDNASQKIEPNGVIALHLR